MLHQYREDFLVKLVGYDIVVMPGYDYELSYFKPGTRFIISPNFAFPNSKDSFALEDALRGDWYVSNTIAHYSDEYLVLSNIAKHSKRHPKPALRVRNLRTNVDFDLLSNDFEISQLATLDLYVTHFP